MSAPDYNRVDYTGWEFLSRPEYDWSNRVVDRACFAQESPDTVVFDPNTTGIVFRNCNLENVIIPDGCTVEGGSTLRREEQNDKRDWIIDDKGNPVEIMNKKYWTINGYSTDPTLIPAEEVLHVDASLLDVLNGDKMLVDVIGKGLYDQLVEAKVAADAKAEADAAAVAAADLQIAKG